MVVYATREDVLSSLDLAESARAGAQLDRLLDAASRSVEALCHRRFYPERATKDFRWPDRQMGTSYRLWLDANELLSVDTLSSGGTAITDYFLEPQSYGPPYSHVEIDRSSSAVFGGGSTEQRNITIAGTFGACNDTAPGSTLGEAMTAGQTVLIAADGASIGVGSLLLCEAEYLQVISRSMVDTTETATAALSASRADTTIQVSDASGFVDGELIRIGAERMRIVEHTAAALIVERAVDASVLLDHAIGAAVYAHRAYVVERGLLGTTAAAHNIGTDVRRHRPPGDVATLVVEEVLWSLQNEESAMARTIGQGDNARQVTASSIKDRREQVAAAWRRMRKRVA